MKPQFLHVFCWLNWWTEKNKLCAQYVFYIYVQTWTEQCLQYWLHLGSCRVCASAVEVYIYIEYAHAEVCVFFSCMFNVHVYMYARTPCWMISVSVTSWCMTICMCAIHEQVTRAIGATNAGFFSLHQQTRIEVCMCNTSRVICLWFFTTGHHQPRHLRVPLWCNGSKMRKKCVISLVAQTLDSSSEACG